MSGTALSTLKRLLQLALPTNSCAVTIKFPTHRTGG